MSIEVNIRKTLGNFTLNVKFSAENEVLSLLGGSGCGKTMTLRCIAGIEKPDEGRIVVNGVTFFDSARRINLPPRRRNVGMLFQNYALFPNMTVEENIRTGLLRERNRSRTQAAVAETIAAYRLEGLEHNYPHQLSGGQQQRVALARSLIGNPSVLLLDEPFSALDSYLRWELERELALRLRDYGGTTIFVSHSRDQVYRISDRIAVYGRGCVDVVDSRDNVFRAPRTRQAALLTGCKNLSSVRRTGADTVYAEEWGVTLTCPREAEFNCVGIRAHAIRPAEDDRAPNSFAYETVETVTDTFNVVRLIRPRGTGSVTPIRWAMSKEAAVGVPDCGFAVFPAESVMYLNESPVPGACSTQNTDIRTKNGTRRESK